MGHSQKASSQHSNELCKGVSPSCSGPRVSIDEKFPPINPLSLQDPSATQGAERILSEQRDDEFIGKDEQSYSSGGPDMSQSETRHSRSKNFLGGSFFPSYVQLFSRGTFLGLSKSIVGLTADAPSGTSRSDICVNHDSCSSSKNSSSRFGLSSPKIDSFFSSRRKKGRNKSGANPIVSSCLSPGKRDLLSRLPGLLKQKFVTCDLCRLLLLTLDVKMINPSVPFVLNAIQKASVGNDKVADVIVIGLVNVPSKNRQVSSFGLRCCVITPERDNILPDSNHSPVCMEQRWKDVCEEYLGGLFPLKGAEDQFHLILPSAKSSYQNASGQLLLPFISYRWRKGVHSVEMSEAIVPSESLEDGPPCGGIAIRFHVYLTRLCFVCLDIFRCIKNSGSNINGDRRLPVLALQRQLFCSVVERLQFNGSADGGLGEYPIVILMGTLPLSSYFADNTNCSSTHKVPSLGVTVTFPETRYSNEIVEYLKATNAADENTNSVHKPCCIPTCEFCERKQFVMDHTSLMFCEEKETGRGAFGTGLLHVSATNSVTLERSITHLRHLYEALPTACQADASPSIELFPPLVDLPPIRPFESYTVTFTIRNTHSTLPACYSLLCLNTGTGDSNSTLVPLTRCSFWHRSTWHPVLSPECMQQQIDRTSVPISASDALVLTNPARDNSAKPVVLERWLLAHPSEGCLLSGQHQVVRLILRIMEGVTSPVLSTSLVIVVRLNDSAKDYFFSLSTSILPSFYCLSIPQLFTLGEHNISSSGETASECSQVKDFKVEGHDQLECLPLPKELWWLFRHVASHCFRDPGRTYQKAFRIGDFLSDHGDISFSPEYLRYQWNRLSAGNDTESEAEVEFVKMCVESGVAIPDTVSLKSALIVIKRWCLSSPWPLLPREFLANIGDETHSLCRAVLLSLPTLQRNVLICVISMIRELWLKEYSYLIVEGNEDDTSNIQNALLEWVCRWVTKDSPHSVAREILHHFICCGF